MVITGAVVVAVLPPGGVVVPVPGGVVVPVGGVVVPAGGVPPVEPPAEALYVRQKSPEPAVFCVPEAFAKEFGSILTQPVTVGSVGLVDWSRNVYTVSDTLVKVFIITEFSTLLLTTSLASKPITGCEKVAVTSVDVALVGFGVSPDSMTVGALCITTVGVVEAVSAKAGVDTSIRPAIAKTANVFL